MSRNQLNHNKECQPNHNKECSSDEFERPSKTLVLIIFTVAVIMKLGIILAEILV
ncbi:uncharacterized protein Dana_GF12523 [Drosophila ananassae]|uniref:Uncharacterized protein n=1 Tax=Drosophila ananassae TaxID=7217 RepID=B3MEP7_DROAN|nr:uncharacterized protein LOC6495373 [Drosophila ananassae]EDV35511.1 uncharacterized protein Dana_GF12523 [Drosophila ananassae]